MLQFIFGKPSSGKTYTVFKKIKELTKTEAPCVLIVPEQYTFESERAVLKLLGDKQSQKVTVLSFSRLIDEINRYTGGLNSKDLGDSDKVIFMKRTLSALKEELRLWGKYSNSISFASALLDTIGEFKINAITPDILRETAFKTQNITLKYKLEDIAKIYETYNTLIGEKFIDPADKLTKLYHKLETFRYFEGKYVFFDSFKGFTGQQYKIIERILNQSENVYIALTNDINNNKDYNIFTNIHLAINKIERAAKNSGKKVLPPIILKNSEFISNEISVIEKLLAGEEIKSSQNSGNVSVCEAATIFDEANFAARMIRKLVRTKNYRFKDFVIIARDADIYKESVSAACKANGISLFFDNRIPLSSFPLPVLASSATKALKFSTENILRFHKTGLGILEQNEISILENYTYLWNIDGSMWLKTWDMNPQGLTNNTTDYSDELKTINALREKAIAPLLKFKDSFKGTASDMAKALFHLFEDCSVTDKLISLSERFENKGDNFSSDALKQSYDEFIRILDSLVTCFAEENIKTDDFCEAMELAVSLCDIGIIPQMLDEVTFGSADRIRPSRPKVAFILGANQGVFPKGVSNSGIFNIFERKSLIENEIEIADNSLFSAIDEDYLVYSSLCSASQMLFISYHSQSITGEKAEPSAFVERIISTFDCDIISEPADNIAKDNLPETANAAFSEFCRRKNSDFIYSNSLKEALLDTELQEKVDFIEDFSAKKDFSLTEETATALYGKKIRMSASKFDTFNRCRFSFFCRYGLNAKKIQPADFDVLQRGTIVHYVLERFIEEHKDNYSAFKEEEFYSLTDKYIEEYLASVEGFSSIRNARINFLISRISRSLREVVCHIAKELSQSSFKPVACELSIGNGGDIKEVIFPYDSGEIDLIGSIDRVDEYNGFIRIIDYKTGSKTFKLPDILFGLNLQMLIYLYAVTRGNGLSDSAAAGILYQPSSRDIKDEGLAMNGLLKADIDLVKAMDKECFGEFVPKLTLNKDNTISKRSGSFIEAEKFSEIFNLIERLMRKTGNLISKGDISVSPLDGRESPACKYCDFASVCGIENKPVKRVENLNMDKVFEKMKEAEENGI